MTNHELTDEELMLRYAKSQDRAAFSLLYDRYFVALSKYITWLSRDLELARDLTQQVLIKIYEQPNLFDRSKKFKPWIFVVAKNHWKNHVRNAQVAQKHYNLHVKDIDSVALPLALETSNNRFSEEDEMKFSNLFETIKQLSASHKEVFLLKYSSNLTIQEISEVCSCSPGTVKSRLFHAIKNIRSSLTINQNSIS